MPRILGCTTLFACAVFSWFSCEANTQNFRVDDDTDTSVDLDAAVDTSSGTDGDALSGSNG